MVECEGTIVERYARVSQSGAYLSEMKANSMWQAMTAYLITYVVRE